MSVAEQAADVLAKAICDISVHGCDDHRTDVGEDCLTLLWYHELGEHMAAAIAGLLVIAELAIDTYRQTADVPRHAWVVPELRDAVVAYLAESEGA